MAARRVPRRCGTGRARTTTSSTKTAMGDQALIAESGPAGRPAFSATTWDQGISASVPVVARWHWEEWGLGDSSGSLSTWTNRQRQCVDEPDHSVTWVAVVDQRP